MSIISTNNSGNANQTYIYLKFDDVLRSTYNKDMNNYNISKLFRDMKDFDMNVTFSDIFKTIKSRIKNSYDIFLTTNYLVYINNELFISYNLLHAIGYAKGKCAKNFKYILSHKPDAILDIESNNIRFIPYTNCERIGSNEALDKALTTRIYAINKKIEKCEKSKQIRFNAKNNHYSNNEIDALIDKNKKLTERLNKYDNWFESTISIHRNQWISQIKSAAAYYRNKRFNIHNTNDSSKDYDKELYGLCINIMISEFAIRWYKETGMVLIRTKSDVLNKFDKSISYFNMISDSMDILLIQKAKMVATKLKEDMKNNINNEK